MKLVTFERRETRRSRLSAAGSALRPPHETLETPAPHGRRLGALLPGDAGSGGRVLDLNRALACRLALEDSGAPEAEADSLLPAEILAFLARGEAAREAARRALAFARDAEGRYDAVDLAAAGALHAREAVRLHAPVPRPGKVLGVARNYAAHAAERGEAAPPSEPVLFVKASSAVNGPEAPIPLPAASAQVDYEGELAAVIGRPSRCVAEAEALGCVAGYACANDVSARDFQGVRGQRFIGKSCDGFAPLGPALVTADELSDPQALGLRTRVSGELVQQASTKEMTFPVPALVAFASRLMTLEPGDVILTGTPAGVGASREPPRFLREGDVVEVEIEGLGRLRNPVVPGR